MNQAPKPETTIEQYESLLEVQLTDVTKEELLQPGEGGLFSVTPEFKILVSNQTHLFLAEKHGAHLDKTFTEGYIANKDGNLEISFKSRIYQPNPGFKGTDEEFENLKVAVTHKLERFITS